MSLNDGAKEVDNGESLIYLAARIVILVMTF